MTGGSVQILNVPLFDIFNMVINSVSFKRLNCGELVCKKVQSAFKNKRFTVQKQIFVEGLTFHIAYEYQEPMELMSRNYSLAFSHPCDISCVRDSMLSFPVNFFAPSELINMQKEKIYLLSLLVFTSESDLIKSSVIVYYA